MNNTQLRTLSFVAIVASTVLSVAVITALSTIEEADARHRSSIRPVNQSDKAITATMVIEIQIVRQIVTEVARLPVIMESALATSK